jgi:hypothetical protein
MYIFIIERYRGTGALQALRTKQNSQEANCKSMDSCLESPPKTTLILALKGELWQAEINFN